jgi:hypothetical protein
MFRNEPPDFSWVIDRVAILEAAINAGVPGKESAGQT